MTVTCSSLKFSLKMCNLICPIGICLFRGCPELKLHRPAWLSLLQVGFDTAWFSRYYDGGAIEVGIFDCCHLMNCFCLLISGTEIAGEVLEIGSKVLRMKPGDRVVALQQSGGGYAEEIIAEDKVSIWLL